jgi:hypothetical protein
MFWWRASQNCAASPAFRLYVVFGSYVAENHTQTWVYDLRGAGHAGWAAFARDAEFVGSEHCDIAVGLTPERDCSGEPVDGDHLARRRCQHIQVQSEAGLEFVGRSGKQGVPHVEHPLVERNWEQWSVDQCEIVIERADY